ncbi:20007_t:CDS:2 [Entrophospora sp. SA101]|nr:20007_t:CDS:2 [Entrophospora sp. SA101]
MSIQNHNPFYKLLEGESQKLLDTRYKDFIGVKSDLESIEEARNLLTKLTKPIIDDIFEFVNNLCINKRLLYSGIPTGLIYSGIDFKQNEKFFKNLTRKLEKKKLNNVILLQPECCNNLKTLMRFVSDTFLDNAKEEEHEKTNHVTYMDIDTDETNTSKDEDQIPIVFLISLSIVNQGAENFRKLPYSVKRLLKLEHFEMPDQLTIFDEFISDAFSQTPRQIITAALGLPTCYLDCNCCPVDSSNAIHNNNSFMANNNNNACDVVDDKVKLDPREQILTTQNDICILYKLYLQLRFIKAFKELKLLGIISTAAKKKDHVKRLLWGTY